MFMVLSYPQGWRGTNGRGGSFVKKHPEPLNPLTPVSGSVLLQCQYERHSCVSPLPHQNGVLWWYDDKSGTQRKWNSEGEWRVYWSALHRLISFSCVSQINGDRLVRLSASASGSSPFFSNTRQGTPDRSRTIRSHLLFLFFCFFCSLSSSSHFSGRARDSTLQTSYSRRYWCYPAEWNRNAAADF